MSTRLHLARADRGAAKPRNDFYARLALITCTGPVRRDLISVKWGEPVKQQVCANLICGQFLVEFYIAVMPDEPVQWIILSYNIYIHHLYGIRLTLTYNVFIVTSTTGQVHNTKFWQRDTWHLDERNVHRVRHDEEGELTYRAWCATLGRKSILAFWLVPPFWSEFSRLPFSSSADNLKKNK